MPLLNTSAHSNTTVTTVTNSNMATLGYQSFYFASSSVWNSGHNYVKYATPLSSFNSHLKIYLLRSFYKDSTFNFDHCIHVHGLAVLIIFCKLFILKKCCIVKKKKNLLLFPLSLTDLMLFIYIMLIYFVFFCF